jgi:transposase
MLLDCHRRHPDPEVRRRMHMCLLILEGYLWQLIAAMFVFSTRTIGMWERRFEEGCTEALRGEPLSPMAAQWWDAAVVGWVPQKVQ